MQVDGLSNVGLDMLSDFGLGQCTRSLSNLRDRLAELGPKVMASTASHSPYQSTLDSCDFQREHLTLEYVEKELINTTHLSTKKMDKSQALALFSKDQVLLGLDHHDKERNHFLTVIASEVAKIIGEARPEA